MSWICHQTGWIAHLTGWIWHQTPSNWMDRLPIANSDSMVTMRLRAGQADWVVPFLRLWVDSGGDYLLLAAHRRSPLAFPLSQLATSEEYQPHLRGLGP